MRWIRFRNSWPSYKIPIGAWGKEFFGFLTDNFDTIFRAFSDGLNFLLDGLVELLLRVPPVLLALVIAVIAWLLQRSRPLAIGVFLGLLFILNQGLWKETVETLVLVVAAAAVSMAIGVPLGIWAAHKPKVYRVAAAGARPDADDADLRLSDPGADPVRPRQRARPDRHHHLRHPDAGAADLSRHHLRAEADASRRAKAFGATKRQLLWKVELPAALPTIMAGLTQCIMLSLSMVVFAALIGAGGLGNPVNGRSARRNIPLGIEAGLAIVILAIILDRMRRVQHGSARNERRRRFQERRHHLRQGHAAKRWP